MAKDGIAHLFRDDELAEAGKESEPAAGKLRGVFFGSVDPTKTVTELFDKPDVARKELRALAKSVKLTARKAEKGVQPEGRIALVWWDSNADKPRRSAAPKGHVFTPRPTASSPRWPPSTTGPSATASGGSRDDVESLSLPAGWAKDKLGCGLTRFATHGLAIGRALSSPGPLASRAFTAECLPARASRAAMEDCVAEWAMTKNARKEHVNEKDRPGGSPHPLVAPQRTVV